MPLHVVYFKDAAGTISLPPTSDVPTPKGYERYECNTIYEVIELERRMQRTATDRAEQEAEHDSLLGEERRKEIRRNIMNRLASSDTDEETKEMLRLWCHLRDETRRKKYADLIHQRIAYFEALHYDKPRNAEEILGESL